MTALLEPTEAEKTALRGLLAKSNALMAKIATEERDLNEDEKAESTEILGKIQDIKNAITTRQGVAKSLEGLADLVTEGGVVTESGLTVPQSVKAGKSLGQNMVDSDVYKNIKSRIVRGDGGVSEKIAIGDSDPIAASFNAKTLVTSGEAWSYSAATSGSAFVNVEHLGLTQDATTYKKPLVVASLFSHMTTETDTIDYVVTDSVTNNAAPVAEATTDAAPTAPGTAGALVYPAGAGLKPNSAVAFRREHTTVKTIAHGIPITKRALADAGQVMAFINDFLQYGLAADLESELLTGSGSGEHLLGLANVSGTLTQAAAPVSPISFDARLLATYRKAKTKVRVTAHVAPTAYLMSPTDAETLDLAAMSTGQYLNGSPFSGGQGRTLWGLPVIESESVADGAPWLAAWDRGVVFDRQQATISMTDSHADFFMRNLVQILAELRVAFAVLNPKAFCKLTLPADNT